MVSPHQQGNPQHAVEKHTAAEEIWLRVPCDLRFWLAEVGDRPARRAALGMSEAQRWR